VAVPQRLFEGIVKLLRGYLALLQVGLHQLFVHLDGLVDDPGVGLRHRGEVGVAGWIEEAVHHLGGARGGQVHRQALVAEGLADAAEQPFQVHALGVDVVDNDHAALLAFAGPFLQPPGHGLDAGLGVDDDGDRVHRGQHAQCLADEVGISGGVDEVDVGAAVVEADQGGAQGVLVFLFEGVGVGDGVAFFHRAGGLDAAGLMEQCLHQGGLAGAGMSDQGDVADFFSGVFGHKPSSLHLFMII
jgi:hypothetical protein